MCEASQFWHFALCIFGESFALCNLTFTEISSTKNNCHATAGYFIFLLGLLEPLLSLVHTDKPDGRNNLENFH